ncbi:hypothetical protein BgiMline_033313, partial [Biomphalaria glabrata]
VKKSLLSRVNVNEKRLSVCAKSLAEGQDLVRKYWRILKENGLTGDDRPNIIPNGYQTFLKQAIA